MAEQRRQGVRASLESEEDKLPDFKIEKLDGAAAHQTFSDVVGFLGEASSTRIAARPVRLETGGREAQAEGA